jgi:hypothetical protein
MTKIKKKILDTVRYERNGLRKFCYSHWVSQRTLCTRVLEEYDERDGILWLELDVIVTWELNNDEPVLIKENTSLSRIANWSCECKRKALERNCSIFKFCCGHWRHWYSCICTQARSVYEGNWMDQVIVSVIAADLCWIRFSSCSNKKEVILNPVLKNEYIYMYIQKYATLRWKL